METPSKSGIEPDIIHALSSGQPPAAIAIVRVSGEGTAALVEVLAGDLPVPRQASLRTLRAHDGDMLDRALVVWFPGPRSATGEDLAEFHLHGGRAVVAAVLAALEHAGSRGAEPGEFTRRALMNGRIDLEGVEGLSDLLAAETEYQRREALRRTGGLLGRRLSAWRDALLNIAAQYEAAIDHDDDVALDTARLRRQVADLHREIDVALSRVSAERLRDGLRVVIVGPANAGKSSLFNALIGSDAAIVSPIAGTTRDLIERSVILGGMPLVLVDTAGLRDANDEIERIGVDRALAARAGADILVDLAGDACAPHIVTVSAKADVELPRPHTLAVSSLTGEGISDLLERLITVSKEKLPAESEVALDHRYRRALERVREEIAQAEEQCDPILTAEHVRLAREAIDTLTGTAGVEDMLDTLFSRFCVGK